MGSGFNGPADVTTWPGNPGLLVVAERGTAHVVIEPVSSGSDSGSSKPPVVDLSGIAYIPTGSWPLEFGGLTGVAFHPRFNDGRRYRFIFVRYNAGDPATGEIDVVIDRFAIPTGVNQASVASRTTVFRETFQTNSPGGHFSGRIRFDPRTFYDGTGTTVDDEIYHLHAPMGDMLFGTTQCDPGLEDAYALTDPNVTPPKTLYAGKLLRFSIGPGLLASGPTVPAVSPSVYGRGLRNPYSFAVDAGGSSGVTEGEVWLADTGSNRPGEIMMWTPPAEGVLDLLSPGGVGEEYGWPWVETRINTTTNTVSNTASACWFGASGPRPFTTPSGFELADYAIPENMGYQAVVGVAVYRGQSLDHTIYEGLLLYAIYGTGSPTLIWRDRGALLDPTPPAPDLAAVLQGGGDPFALTGVEQWALVGVGEDTDGDLLLIRMDQAAPLASNGTIFRVTQ